MKKVCYFCAMVGVCVLTSVFGAAPSERLPIIDVHLHAFGSWGSGVWAATGQFNYPPVDPLGTYTLSDLTDGTDMLLAPAGEAAIRNNSIDILKAYNIKAIASGTPNRVLTWKNAAPEHIIPGYQFAHPSNVSVDQLRQRYLEGKFQVFAEVTTQYRNLAPDDPSLEPYFALAEELDIPMGIHMGLGPPGAFYLGNTGYRATNSNPLLLEPVLMKHPELRIYVMHAGWPMLDEMIHLLYSHPQVYVDLGIIDWGIPRAEFYFYLQRLINAGFEKRIMFGSDQMVWPEAIVRAIENIEAAEFLSEEQKRDIFYNNAVRFFRTDFTELNDTSDASSSSTRTW